MQGRLRGLACVAGMLIGALATEAAAQDAWPARSIRWVVPYVPGGGTDITARILAPKLSEGLGQQIVVENRGGSGGNVGTELVVNSAPDGYTWLFMTVANSINDSLYAKLPFKVERDLTPVGLISSLPNVLEVKLALPVKSVPELIAYGKANPGKLNFGSGGTGTSVHLSGELFKVLTGITMEHVPYRGAAAALNEVIAGQIDLLFDNLPGSIEQIRAGKVRALAVTTTKRNPQLPDLPTIAEAGVPGFESSSWYAIAVPSKVPREIVAKINRELVRVMQLPEIRERIAQLGSEPMEGTSEAASQHLRKEIEKWAKIVQASGAKAE